MVINKDKKYSKVVDLIVCLQMLLRKRVTMANYINLFAILYLLLINSCGQICSMSEDSVNYDDFVYYDFLADLSFATLQKDIANALSTCKTSFRRASDKAQNLLNSAVLKNFELDFQDSQEMDNKLKLHSKLDDVDNMISSIIKQVMKNNNSEVKSFNDLVEKPHYLKQMEILVNAIDQACSTLPHIFPTRVKRSSTRATLHNIGQSLLKWTERWSSSIEIKLEKFVDSCLKHKPCKPFMFKMIEHGINFLETEKSELGEETSDILKQLLTDMKWDRRKNPHLNQLQRLALADHFDPFYQGSPDTDFNFAQHVSGVEDTEESQLNDILSSISKTSRIFSSKPQGLLFFIFQIELLITNYGLLDRKIPHGF